MIRVERDPRLNALVEQLRRDLGSDYFVEVPHWDGDLLAVGLGRPDDARVLVYLAIAQHGGSLFYECEWPAEDPYTVARRGDGVGYDEVREAVRQHLAPVVPGHGRRS